MLQKDQIIDSTYQVIEEIGRGGAGTVYLAWHLRLQKYVVLKQISGSYMTDYTRTEVDILKGLHHPNLPQVYDYIQMQDSVFTVMDYIEGTDLEKCIKNGWIFEPDTVIQWFRQLTDVLVYLHGRDPAVIHSDIKPANIIITPENDAVLIDFNVSLSRNTDTVIGLSLDYASPEQISMLQQQYFGTAGTGLDGRSDIYSLAASFYHLITGIKPSVFYGTAPIGAEKCGFPEIFCMILNKAMAADRDNRYLSSFEMKKALDSMWRRSAAFKRRMAIITVAALTGILMMGFVLFFIIKGVRNKEHEEFISTYNRCVEDVNGGNISQAISECLDFLNSNKEKLAADPDMKTEILMGLGKCYLYEGRYSEAVDMYTEAAALSTNSRIRAECYKQAVAAYEGEGDTQSAEYYMELAGGCYTDLIEAGSSRADDYLSLATMQRLKGRYDECLDTLNKLEISKILSGNEGILYMHRAFVCEAMGDAELTVENLKKAREENLTEQQAGTNEWEFFNILTEKYGL